MGDKATHFTTNRRRKRCNTDYTSPNVSSSNRKRLLSNRTEDISSSVKHSTIVCSQPSDCLSRSLKSDTTSVTATSKDDIDYNVAGSSRADPACSSSYTSFYAGVSSAQPDYSSFSKVIPPLIHNIPYIPGPPPLKPRRNQQRDQNSITNPEEFHHTHDMNSGSAAAMVDAIWDDSNGHRLHNHHHHHHLHHLPDSPGLGGKPRCSANARERDRTHSVNTAFLTLRTLIPTGESAFTACLL
ncbi:transcription factor 15 [Elysia marginata]|uniref:Transcription factor 15 n=1 Tax=Elysia marginata TaxID=1093978 RepID=A0AAV4GDL1_9GAST|nr:transcription factor 15 [Elysia marginata]